MQGLNKIVSSLCAIVLSACSIPKYPQSLQQVALEHQTAESQKASEQEFIPTLTFQSPKPRVQATSSRNVLAAPIDNQAFYSDEGLSSLLNEVGDIAVARPVESSKESRIFEDEESKTDRVLNTATRYTREVKGIFDDLKVRGPFETKLENRLYEFGLRNIHELRRGEEIQPLESIRLTFDEAVDIMQICTRYNPTTTIGRTLSDNLFQPVVDTRIKLRKVAASIEEPVEAGIDSVGSFLLTEPVYGTIKSFGFRPTFSLSNEGITPGIGLHKEIASGQSARIFISAFAEPFTQEESTYFQFNVGISF